MAGMQSKFHYKIGQANHIGVITPNDDCDFGFMGQAGANPTYYFGGYSPDGAAHFLAEKDGETWDVVRECTVHQTTQNFIDGVTSFLQNCKNYIVTVEHKLKSDEYDDMVQGVVNWIADTEIEFWFNTFSQAGNFLFSFGASGLDIINLSGTNKLEECGALYGFLNIGEVVKNIYIKTLIV